MKTKLVLSVCLFVLFSCASKSIVTNSTSIKKTEVVVSNEFLKKEISTVQEIPNTSKMVMLTQELYESKNLYENSCNRCHKLYEPTDFNKSDWPSILYSMQKKAKLNDQQVAGLLSYINSQI